MACIGTTEGCDPFGLWDELTADEVDACRAARQFVDEQALPVLAGLTADEPLPEGLLARLRGLRLPTSSPVGVGLFVLELCRGDVRLWWAHPQHRATGGCTAAWEALGQATAAYDVAEQHRATASSMHEPLVRMADDLGAMQLVCFRLGRLAAEGGDSASLRAVAARHNTWTALGVVELAHELLGPDADRPELHVARHLRSLRHGPRHDRLVGADA